MAAGRPTVKRDCPVCGGKTIFFSLGRKYIKSLISFGVGTTIERFQCKVCAYQTQRKKSSQKWDRDWVWF